MPPAVYIVGLLALFVALVLRSPLFGFFVFTGYLSVEALPGCGGARRRWRSRRPCPASARSAAGRCRSGRRGRCCSRSSFVNVFIAGAMFAAAEISEERGRQREEMEREAGVMQERQRLAREIHDTIAQDLTGIVAQLEAAAQARAPRRRRQRLPRRGDASSPAKA